MDNSVTKKRAQSNEIDMLNGPLFKKILLFALPLAASSLLQELFNSVDVAVVGHFVGSRALAAVGSNAPVIGLLINLFMGVSMGACAIISNHIGQQDDRCIRNAISTVQLVALLSGFFLLVLGQVAARTILTWMGTPPDVLDEAVTYLRIYFLGMPFIMAFNFGAAILRSMGDTRRPLYILVMAGVVNTLLNLLFVIGFGMGVAGVAVATGIANAVSATLIIRLLRKEKEPFRLHFDKMKIHGVELSRMLRIGVPAGVQGMIFSISNVVVQSSINSYGADAIAGSSAALNFEYYCYFIIQDSTELPSASLPRTMGPEEWTWYIGCSGFAWAQVWLSVQPSTGFLPGRMISSWASFRMCRWCIISVLSACTLCWPVSLLPAVTRLPVHRCAVWESR